MVQPIPEIVEYISDPRWGGGGKSCDGERAYCVPPDSREWEGGGSSLSNFTSSVKLLFLQEFEVYADACNRENP